MRRLGHRVGHRGVALLFFALVDLIYGPLLIYAQPQPGSSLAYLSAHWPPMRAWGTVWILVGLTCLVFAFLRQDTPAFVAAIAIKFAWAAANLWAFLDSGNVWALGGTVIWVMALGMVANQATWAEPPPRPGGDP